jgi:cytochrome c
MNMKLVMLAAAAALSMSVFAHAQEGDAAAGEKVFLKCKACHENEKGVNKVGPTLKGVVGRKTASVEGFNYSNAMKAKGTAGQVWDEATLAAYLPDPKAWVPGTKMAFAGLKKPEEVANIIAYLKAHP